MYSVVAMLGLMFLTWGVAIWATFDEQEDYGASSQRGATEFRKAA